MFREIPPLAHAGSAGRAVVSSTQAGTITSMTYANSAWNGNIFAAFK
jgi:hypothetical protein